jgi:hypothetical protein
MPLLAPMPGLWPEGILEFAAKEREPGPHRANWLALKVQPRCEKHVARGLKQQSAAYFLCLRTTSRTYQRRRVVSQTPLFPGYVFAAADAAQLS